MKSAGSISLDIDIWGWLERKVGKKHISPYINKVLKEIKLSDENPNINYFQNQLTRINKIMENLEVEKEETIKKIREFAEQKAKETKKQEEQQTKKLEIEIKERERQEETDFKKIENLKGIDKIIKQIKNEGKVLETKEKEDALFSLMEQNPTININRIVFRRFTERILKGVSK